MTMFTRKRRSAAGIPRRHHAADYDDVQYVGTGYHVTTAASGTGGKRVGYCDCASAWPPSHDLVQRTNLMWQTSGVDETSPTLSSTSKTIYCRHPAATSGCTTTPLKSAANTPDLFVDARPEVPATSSSSNMADATGRVKTAAHLYESPVFSHLDRLLH